MHVIRRIHERRLPSGIVSREGQLRRRLDILHRMDPGSVRTSRITRGTEVGRVQYVQPVQARA